MKDHVEVVIPPTNIFIDTRLILLTKSKGYGSILLELFPFVVLNVFLYRGLCLCYNSLYGSLSKNGGIVVLFNFLAYVPSIFLFLCLQHLATLWVTKTEYYVRCPMTLFENST